MQILALILLSSVSVYGAEKPVCDANAVTRSCKFFEERKDQARIKLPDGSSIANPMYVANYARQGNGAGMGGNGYGGGMGGGNYGFNAPTLAEIDALQANQADIMDQLPNNVVSTRFKMNFANSAGQLAASPDTPFTMIWPPNARPARMSAVTGKEVFAYLKSKMKKKDYEDLMKLVDVQKAPALRAAQESQRMRQEMAALEQKQQEEALAESQRVQGKKNKIRELFKYTQEQMIAMVAQGKKESELSPEQKGQIEKIRTVSLHKYDDPNVTMSAMCQGAGENAYYMSSEHDVSICPGIFKFSDAAIVSLLGHEIGHAIDGCRNQMPLWKVNSEKMEEFNKRQDLTDADRSAAMSFMNRNGAYINYDLKLQMPKPDVVDKLEQSGVLKKEVAESSFNKYPQFKELECLSKNEGFRINDASDIVATRRALNRFTAPRQSPEQRATRERTLQRYGDAMERYPQCMNTIKGASTAGELSADIYGALILEKYLMDFPPKTEEEKVSSVGMWVTGSCGVGTPISTYNSDGEIPPETFSQNLGSVNRYETHPNHTMRLGNVYLNLPGMAKVFDCKRQATACFDHMSFYKRAGNSQRSSSESRSQQGAD